MAATFSDPPPSKTLAVHFCTSRTIFGLSMFPITHSRCYKIVSPAMHNVCNIKIDPYIIMTRDKSTVHKML